MVEVLIVHYNTPELTEAAIRSLWKHTPEARVTVFDNSDKRPFVPDRLNGLNGQDKMANGQWSMVNVIDNTKGQFVDWDRWLEQYPDKKDSPKCKWGSAKHCYSIEVCMDRFPNGFILMDSDVLIKHDISDLVDTSVPWKGDVLSNTKRRFGVEINRVVPFVCWINTPMLKQYGIRYFNAKRMWEISPDFPSCYYDTGAAFLEACENAGIHGIRIHYGDYAVHFAHGSWGQKKDAKAWLREHRSLWKEDNLRIYVCTHTDFKPVVRNHVYETVDARQFNGDVCENGLRGSFYSELISYKYIAERNNLPRYVGVCGYRKYFSFMDNVPDMDEIFKEYDAIATTPVTLKPNVRGQYASCHNIKDLDAVTDIVREHYPDLWPTYERSLRLSELYACNMFIVRREDFLWIIRTVFDILDKYLEIVGTDIEGRIAANPQAYHIGEIGIYTPQYEYRIGGFLGERIVNALLRYRFKNIMHYKRVKFKKRDL